jgi:hypothetical protein
VGIRQLMLVIVKFIEIKRESGDEKSIENEQDVNHGIPEVKVVHN